VLHVDLMRGLVSVGDGGGPAFAMQACAGSDPNFWQFCFVSHSLHISSLNIL